MEKTNQLYVTLVQPDVFWEDRTKNLEHLYQLLATTTDTDIIVLPEMFPTGFSMQPERFAETMDGVSVNWMKSLALQKNSIVVGSIIIRDNDQFLNRLVWMRPDGQYNHYDKRHLFSFANEHDHYSSGGSRLVVQWKGWRICPMICYDLRFPVWCRNQAHDGSSPEAVFDLQIFVANWPKARQKPWSTLLEARAHENQCYVIGVNRVGEDGNNIAHSGDSAIFSAKGEMISDIESDKEEVKTFSLKMNELNEFRNRFTAWKDKDSFRLD